MPPSDKVNTQLTPLSDLDKDYSEDYPGVAPELFWCVANQTNRVALCQGFYGVWKGRDDEWWFPAMGYTSKPPYVYKNKRLAIIRAIESDFGLKKRLATIEAQVDEIDRLDKTSTPYDVIT